MDRLPTEKKQQHRLRRPIECRFCKEHQNFRVTHARGNTLHRGGYGYVISASTLDEEAQADVVEETEDTLIKDPVRKCENKKVIATAQHYLFIEEVLFLFEQGLLHAFRDKDDDTARVTRTKPNEIVTATPAEVSENDVDAEPMSRYELFQWLETAGVALPSYLVYQHLRAQTFRVVRHTPTRRSILLQQQLVIAQAHQNGISTASSTHPSLAEEGILVLGSDAESRSSHVATDLPPTLDATTSTAAPPHRPHTLQYWKRQLRGDARRALPPQFGGIAWDGYRPTASFAAAAPGLPDFYVAMAHMTNAEEDDAATSSTFTYRDLQSLLQETIVPSANRSVKEREEMRIPLKIATVSDSGTVLLFGITDFGVPMNLPPEVTPAVPGDT